MPASPRAWLKQVQSARIGRRAEKRDTFTRLPGALIPEGRHLKGVSVTKKKPDNQRNGCVPVPNKKGDGILQLYTLRITTPCTEDDHAAIESLLPESRIALWRDRLASLEPITDTHILERAEEIRAILSEWAGPFEALPAFSPSEFWALSEDERDAYLEREDNARAILEDEGFYMKIHRVWSLLVARRERIEGEEKRKAASERNRTNREGKKTVSVTKEQLEQHREAFIAKHGNDWGWISKACEHFKIDPDTLHDRTDGAYKKVRE